MEGPEESWILPTINVAATRAKFDKDNPGTLIFCGGIPEIYGAAETV
jgi:hypothetical protein